MSPRLHHTFFIMPPQVRELLEQTPKPTIVQELSRGPPHTIEALHVTKAVSQEAGNLPVYLARWMDLHQECFPSRSESSKAVQNCSKSQTWLCKKSRKLVLDRNLPNYISGFRSTPAEEALGFGGAPGAAARLSPCQPTAWGSSRLACNQGSREN